MQSYIQKLMGYVQGIKRPFVVTKKLRFAYNDTEVLKNINFSLQKSQIVAVVGRSGEGKSTFLHLLVGVLESSFKGDIKILGRKRAFAKKDIGFVPQHISLIPDLTIEENIVFFGNMYGLTDKEALAAGQSLMQILHLNVSLTKRPTQLSGGQRVRLNILVSLLHDPKVLILDEPFVGLDYYNRKLLWHFLQHQKNRHKAVVLTTHMLVEAEHHTDQIVLLHKGKVYAKGKLKDIRKKLKTLFIAEYKFGYVSKTNMKEIEKYCVAHDITIMDTFNNYMMFSIMRDGQRAYLMKHFDKLGISYEEISFREPNLDELFLRVMHV